MSPLPPLRRGDLSAAGLDRLQASAGNRTTASMVQREAEATRRADPKLAEVQLAAAKGDWKGVLALFDYDWFKAKEALAYQGAADAEARPWEYGDQEGTSGKLQIMRRLLAFRLETVDALLGKTMQTVAATIAGSRDSQPKVEKILNSKSEGVGYKLVVPDPNGFTITAFAPGSTAETSDYDITFSVSGKPAFEVDLVKTFNATFRQQWGGLESGRVFDTNVYTSGFMPETSKKGDETVVTYKDKYEDKTDDEVAAFKTDKHRVQLALSILPIRQYFTDKNHGDGDEAGWEKFAADASASLAAFLKERDVPDEVITAGTGDLSAIFALAVALDLETSQWKEQMAEELQKANPDVSPPHIESIANNRLYEQQLDRVRRLIEEREGLVERSAALLKAKDGDSVAAELKKVRRLLAQNVTSFQFEQGKALVYANEAYFSGGPAVHVVLGIQGGGKVELGRQQQMQSLLMNIGYKLAHAEHLTEEGGQGRALVGSAKYGQRIRNLVISGRTGKDPLYKSGVEPKLFEHMTQDDLDLLDTEERLITDYKKNSKLSSPSAKESQATKDLGASMKPEALERSYLTIATKLFGPFYLSKYLANQQGQEKRAFWER